MDNSQNNQKASLGFGTLIIIALIVLIFGAGPSKQQTDALRQDVRALEAAVSGQRQDITQLKEMVAKLLGPADQASIDQ